MGSTSLATVVALLAEIFWAPIPCSVGSFRKVLFEEFRVWLSNVTQIDLEPTIDLSCAKYDYTGEQIPLH